MKTIHTRVSTIYLLEVDSVKLCFVPFGNKVITANFTFTLYLLNIMRCLSGFFMYTAKSLRTLNTCLLMFIIGVISLSTHPKATFQS